MKTSMLIIAALFFNTTLLIAEPLAGFVKNISPFIFIGVEAALLIGYFLNNWLRDLNKAYAVELGYLNIFVVDSK